MAKEENPDQSPRKRVTHNDIAAALGVSHVTVSLALRNHPRISEATRLRVQQAAKELGYHPDPMLSALSHYRLASQDRPIQATLAWINPLKNPEKLRQLEEFYLYRKGAEAVATHLGFHIEEFAIRDISLQRMDGIFKTRSIRGLIIVPLALEPLPVDWDVFPWQDYAGVRFGRSHEGPLLHLVTSAHVSNAMLAFEKTLEKGYKRIGFIGNISRRRMFNAGYLRAQQRLPKSQQLPMLNYEGDPNSLRLDLLDKWIKKNRPDAILTDNFRLPSLLESLGIRVPEDIGIATMSIHDTPINAGIDQNPEEIGRATVRTLVALMNEHHYGIPEIRNQILVEGRWVEGSTLPARS